MNNPRAASVVLLAAIGIAAAPIPAFGQMSLHGRAEMGRVEYRVRDAGPIEPSSGFVFGGALGLVLGDRFEIWSAARGGRLAAGSSTAEDRDFAAVQLLGGARLRPWLTAQAGVDARAYTTPLARQHWTTLWLGAEAHVPLAVAGVRGVVRGQWMPLVSVSGRAGPNAGLAAGAGVEWRGSRVSVGALYTLERYDFPGSGPTQRLEELSSLELRSTVQFR